ncbi:hypothetical protein H7169_03775, partial [Candidatus Gracilibacteria bacterium]|nr:hypothetical protein [Candidatus Gracilibacteria bacterium]
IPFFLLSHTKKEHLRGILPFRLSDTQAIVFIMSILLMTLLNLVIVNSLYTAQLAVGATLGIGFKMAFSSITCILVASYFLSKSTKSANTDIYYIDHQTDDELDEYRGILTRDDEKKKKNMSLPI